MTQRDQQIPLVERAAARLLDAGFAPKTKLPNPPTTNSPYVEGVPPLASKGEPSVVIEEGALAKAGLIAEDQAHSRFSEELSILQNNLLRRAFNQGSTTKGRSNLILVTSAVAGEGKSFISLNLAAGFARQSGRRVILVNGDAKPNGLRQIFGHAELPGLLELVSQSGIDVENLLLGTCLPNLELLPLGNDVKRSSDLITTPHMLELLDGLSRRYSDRVILLDSPPCLSSSVPHALAQVVGQVLFVIAAGETQQEDIEASLTFLETCPQISLMLNKVPTWNSHSFGLYSYLQK